MQTYISDIIPKLKKFSSKLDNDTLLVNHPWRLISKDLTVKIVYIFRKNGELILSTNGSVEKGKWEYLGNNSLLIDKKEQSFLLNHGFLDSAILALKVDGKDEYAFFVNEIMSSKLISIEMVDNYLEESYIQNRVLSNNDIKKQIEWQSYKTKIGIVEIPLSHERIGQPIKLNGNLAPDGKYKIEFMDYVTVKGGIIIKDTLF